MPSPTLTLLTVDPQQAAWDATITENMDRLIAWLTEQPLFVFPHVAAGAPAAADFQYCLMFLDDVLCWSNGTAWVRVAPLATTADAGLVKQAVAVADVGAMVTTETATGAYGANEQGMLNHLKTDVTALRTTLNDLLARLRTATSLAP